jgi:hypothetical protein
MTCGIGLMAAKSTPVEGIIKLVHWSSAGGRLPRTDNETTLGHVLFSHLQPTTGSRTQIDNTS